MNLKKCISLCLLLSLLLMACDLNIDDENEELIVILDELPEAHIVTENGFDCNEYKLIDFIENDESVRFLEVVGDIIYYTNFDHQIKAYSIPLGTTELLAETQYVAEMNRQENSLHFCTWSGIFSVESDDTDSFQKISEYSCSSLEQTVDNGLFFTGFNSSPELSMTTASHIYKVVSMDSVVQITVDKEEWISIFKVLKNNEIIAFNRNNTDAIYHYNSAGEIINIFDSSNSGLNAGHHDSHIWTTTEDDRLVAVLKNGVGFPDILEWDYGSSTWYDYVNKEDFEFESERQWKLADFMAPLYSDVELKNGVLYVATTLSGCRGIQKIDLTSVGQTLTIEDITIVKDSKLNAIGHCVQGINFDVDRNRFIIYSQKGLMIVSNCN
ncbi:hypothetical protein [Phaeodactylibacter xiamenensis]|uniref:hypothetical protein n=1 Tax=Phaeodactylibacter xiamenensis TaxID=1524460 RepID=UPI003BA8F4EB